MTENPNQRAIWSLVLMVQGQIKLSYKSVMTKRVTSLRALMPFFHAIKQGYIRTFSFLVPPNLMNTVYSKKVSSEEAKFLEIKPCSRLPKRRNENFAREFVLSISYAGCLIRNKRQIRFRKSFGVITSVRFKNAFGKSANSGGTDSELADRQTEK
jgi:hypothetical protein